MIEFAFLPALCAAVLLSSETDAPSPQQDKDAEAILAVERAAFERWAKGDFHGFTEASDPEVNYFDPFLEKRLDGQPALRALYDQFQGKVKVDRWEMIDPKVVVSGDMGVLTFNFVSYEGDRVVRWNTTEVYRRTKGQWKIIHTHWALTKPELVHPLL